SHKNLVDLVDDMKSQPLGRAIGSIDFVRLALDLDIPLERVELLRRIRDFVSSPEAAMLFEELGSKKVALALLKDDGANNLKAYINDNLVFFAQPKHATALLEIVAGLFIDDTVVTSTQYGSHIIHRVSITQERILSFTVHKKLVIATLQERTLRSLLDRNDEQQKNLGENFFYTLFSKQLKNSQLFCYFSIQHIRRFLEDMLNTEQMPQKELQENLQNWEGFTAGGYGATVKDGYTMDTIFLHFNKHKLNEGTARFLEIHPQKNTQIENIPVNLSLYYWTNTFDLKTMWRMYARESGMDEYGKEEIEDVVTSVSGIPFVELLQIIDNTFHVIIGRPSPKDFVPLPNFAVMLHLRDSGKAGSAMKNFLKTTRIPHNSHIYREFPFTYWGQQLQEGLQPVYTIHEDILYMSSSLAMHRQVIDAVIEGGGIVVNETFKKSATTLLQENNSMIFVQLQPLLTSLEDIAGWLQTMLSIQNRSTAYKSRKVIENLILPMLDGLKMYSTLATRSYTGEGRIVIESYRIRKEQLE
ncbi:MAG TPA: hypothetical protein VJ969_02945, partial [Desulfopila sp.]|nr:hypothetical protein [Desulfopila sp.]